MYTSDIKETRKKTLKTVLIYVIISIFCAVFGAVYEIFSHGVYSGFMIYAFAFPLLGGVLPFLLLSLRGGKGYPGILSRCIYHSSILALTVGSLMTGILEIYGTTNHLLSVYWVTGILLLLAAIIIHVASLIIRPGKAKQL